MSFFRALDPVSPMGILRADARLSCQWVNHQWCETSGRSAAESMGRGWLRAVHPEDRRLLLRTWAGSQSDPFCFEFRIRRTDGSERWVCGRGAAETDENGKIVAYVGTTTEITEHRELRQRLEEARKLEAVGRLAAGIGHDINNLLTIITGYSALLQDGMSSNHPALGAMQAIHHAAQQAAQLTGQLTAFGAPRDSDSKVVNFNAVLDRLEPALQSIAGERVTLETSRALGLKNVELEHGEAEQLVVNMVTNACDAMPEGGSLRIETLNIVRREPSIEGKIELPAGDYVALAVSDTGVGMDSKVQDRIFEPFFTTKSRSRNSGLGLAAAYETVRHRGGAIRVRSAPEKGSRFSVYLPAVSKAALDIREPRHDTTPVLDATVLVVEDNDALRCLVQEVLEGNGCRVVAAEGPEPALIALSHMQPDLILTDVIMPVMNGPEMVDRMLEINPRLRVLYMSGYASNALEGRARIGPGQLLRKPFSPSRLVRAVADALSR